jgi:hypothetical protein
MNGKKESNWSLIILCAMLIAKYEQTYLQKNSRTINDGGLVALCQEVDGVFSGFLIWHLCDSALPQGPNTSHFACALEITAFL